jgi:hypothetical protein
MAIDAQMLEFDSVLGSAFAVAAAVTLGLIGTLSVVGVDLTASQTIAGVSLANASLISLAALAGVFAVNKPDLERMSTETQILAAASVALVGTFAISPDTLSALTFSNSPVLAGVAFAIESGGFWAIATAQR